MAKPKGLPKTGGREKGSLNKVTKDQKAFYVDLLSENQELIKEAFIGLLQTDQAKALSIVLGMSEFVISKLQRTETSVKMTMDETKKSTFDLFPKIERPE